MFKQLFLKNWKRLLVLLVAIAIVLLVAKQYFLPQSSPLPVAIVKRGNLENSLTIPGQLDASERVTLQFQAAGQLSWVGVKEGDQVQRFQVLASLDQRQLEKSLQKYLNTYLKTRQDFDQNLADDKNQILTDEMKRVAAKYQADLNNSVLDVEIADLAKRYATLWTPIEGVVTRVTSPYAGVNISLPTQAQFDVANPQTIFFSGNADQSEVTLLSPGQEGELSLDSFPEKTFLGKIEKISFIPTTSETGAVYQVKFSFPEDNSSYRFKMGMTGDLTFVTDRRENVLYVPGNFVKTDGGKKYVTVQSEGAKSRREVKTGLETDESVEIASGLKEGETVVREK